MLDRLTFVLAFAGYAGLATTAVLAARGRFPVRLWRLVVAVIVAHVALVWVVRYGGQFAAATRNGYAGFVVFHGALAMIVAAAVVGERRARLLVWMAFVVVSAGAMGAVFLYDEVAFYRAPVILTAILGAVGLVRARSGR